MSSVAFTAEDRAVLASIADTLFASIKLDDNQVNKLAQQHHVDPVLIRKFFELKPSDNGTIEEIVTRLQRFVRAEDVRLIKFLLGTLGSTLGTFAMTGNAVPFDRLSPQLRELALLNWSQSLITPFRKVFIAFRSLVCSTLFTNIDKNLQNIVWPAIGYPGPPRELLINAHDDFEFQFQDPFKLSPDGQLHFDVVIIGSGCGGGVSAGVLAQAGFRVLVLEKAPNVKRSELTLTEHTYQTMFENGGMVTTADTSVTILAGSTFGGGSQINWSASFRTPDHVRKEWAEKHQLPFFVSKEYDAAMDAVCSRLGVHADEVEHNFQNTCLLEGSAKLNQPCTVIPRNAPGAHNCGWCTFGCARGLKQGMKETFLRDAANHGAKFIVGATVTKILHHKGVARGVIAQIVDSKGELKTFEVRAKAVVLSGGSLNSPLLLKRSGLKNPNIGKHLRLHPVVCVRGIYPDQDVKPWDGCNMSAVSHVVSNRDGQHYGALIETPPLHPSFLSIAVPWHNAKQFKTDLLNYNRTAVLIVLTRDKGEGSVDIDRDGFRVINYPLLQFDKESLMDGVIKSLQIFVAAGAKEVFGGHSDLDSFHPKSTDINEPSFQQYLTTVRSFGIQNYKTAVFSAHQMGTCRLGNDQGAGSVLNPLGETWEVKNLFVADASTFPTSSGVNPMITTESIAYSIAQNVARRLREQAATVVQARL